MKSIGWIGVGIMGKPMVRNLQKAGYTLHIYARNREKVADVIQEGAIFHDTIGDCAQGRDAVITMVGFPKDVEEVYFAPGNILDRADPGTYLIDMTTTSPALAQRIFQQGRQRGLRVLDAPVTGGDIGARAGTLSILVGGEAADYQACRPLLAAMGTNLSHQGPAGCGQHAKLANQIMIAGTLSGLCEGLRYADLVKLSEEELEFLTKAADHTAGMRELLERYDIRMLVVTLGADGCLCLCRNGVFLRQHTIQVTALDTTGSGDAFWGTFLSELLLCDCCDRIPAPQVLQHILGVSCVAGSLTATAFGAVPAMPTASALHAGMLRLLER